MKNLRFLTATRIFPAGESFPDEAVLVFNGSQLTDILPRKELDPGKIETYNGTLIPGFINAHCHLELSHTKGKIKPGTGLTPFLHAVVTQEPVPDDVILDAIAEADREMEEAGIVAVGDISNLPFTASTKATSEITYYTFVEMFDFLDPRKTDQFYDQYESVYQHFLDHNLAYVTRVPHSPYTVSQKLMGLLSGKLSKNSTGSIHMLENEQEDLLMTGKGSEYYEFFDSLGFSLDHFEPPGHGSLKEFVKSAYAPKRMLFVHNTIASESDLEQMKNYNNSSETFLVTCPNANLYIESRLPDYELWKQSGLPICIGTDSYASNHQLSIWSEICTIKSNHNALSWEELICWGTLHGARALGLDDKVGSFEIGKSPGVLLIEHRDESRINTSTTIRKLL